MAARQTPDRTPRKTVDEYFAALTVADADRLLKTVSTADHFTKIGTDRGEIVRGGGQAPAYYRDHASSTSDFSIDTRRLEIQQRETVAWFFTEQTWRLRWRGQRETLDMRITGTLELEPEGWKFVQLHASIGV